MYVIFLLLNGTLRARGLPTILLAISSGLEVEQRRAVLNVEVLKEAAALASELFRV